MSVKEVPGYTIICAEYIPEWVKTCGIDPQSYVGFKPRKSTIKNKEGN